MRRSLLAALAAIVVPVAGGLLILLPGSTPADTAAKSEPAKPAEAAPGKPAEHKSADKPKSAEKPKPADNSYCYVCHANYEEEKLTKIHQPQGVGCEKCHGSSEKHSSDEDGLTPPQTMYPKSEIAGACMKCHKKEDLVKEEDHGDFFVKPKPAETCTDCHGKNHRLKVRTRIWDKKTGKLLSDDGVRMMSPDASKSPAGTPKGK
jgi:hypothetical protein